MIRCSKINLTLFLTDTLVYMYVYMHTTNPGVIIFYEQKQSAQLKDRQPTRPSVHEGLL